MKTQETSEECELMCDASVVGFREYGYWVTWKLSSSELRRIGQLRAEVFSRELGWVGSRTDAEETDEFDAGSTPIALLDPQTEIVGSVRLTMPDQPWMLDTVFRELDPSRTVMKSHDTAEVSRLLLVRASRNVRLARGVCLCDLLYKATYLYCHLRAIRYLYMVTTAAVLRHLRQRGLPCRALGQPRRMPDGTSAVVVRLDWRALEETSAVAHWYRSIVALADQSVGVPARHPMRAHEHLRSPAVVQRAERTGMRAALASRGVPDRRQGFGLT